MMLGLEILGLIALQLYDLHYALSVFQQCHYHLDRYRNWVAEHFSIQRLWRRIQSFLPFCFSFSSRWKAPAVPRSSA